MTKLPVLSVLSVRVFISYPEYISYIILGRNFQNSCLNAFRVMERHAPLPLPSDLEKIVSQAKILVIQNMVCEHILGSRSLYIYN